MIYELLATALLACSMGASTYKDEPKRVVIPNVFGDYEASVTYDVTTGDVYGIVDGPNGGNRQRLVNWEDVNARFSLNTSNNLMTTSFHFWQENNYAVLHCDGHTTFNFNGLAEEERFEESYFQMQEDGTYSTSAGFEIDEMTNEANPEIFWYCEFYRGTTYEGYLRMNLPFMYMVNIETFGTQELSSVSYMKQGEQFQKTFNAIYEDNTEPKLYAFWLDKFMLARQIRLNGEIINQNYVTGMDRIDPLFGKQAYIRFTPNDDVYLKVSATPYDPSWELTNNYNIGYNQGFADGKEEGQQPVSWIKTTFDGIAGFFNIQVFPFVTLGFLCFAPLIVVAIVAILRIIKHD